MRSVSELWLSCLIWVLLWPEMRPLWPWQGLVLLGHDASITPCACLLPGPKTICYKLLYGLFRLICCLRTWCDWVSIHTTTLKLPASWPQTPIVTASVQDRRSGVGLCLAEGSSSSLMATRSSSSSEWDGREPKRSARTSAVWRARITAAFIRQSNLRRRAAHFVGILQSHYKKETATCEHLLFIKMPVIFGHGTVFFIYFDPFTF